MSSKTCPICRKEYSLSLLKQTSRDYLSGNEFHFFECRSCRVAFTHIPPSQETIDYYGAGYYNRKSGKFLFLLEEIFRLNLRKNARRLYRKFHPANVLEVGCGRAYILSRLKKMGCNVHCMESEEAAQWILENPEVNMVASGEDTVWPFDADSFDLVIFWHVLEHLPDPAATLREAGRVLKPGQFLCISLPNRESLQCRLNPATWFHLDVPRHRYHFGKKNLVDWLQRNGYEVTNVTSGDAIQNLYGWFQSIANLFTPQRHNTLYRFLQGGRAWENADKELLLTQLASIIFWLPMGLFGFFIEAVLKRYGTVTIFARKKK